MRCALMVASGAAWEASAFGRLTEEPGLMVLKRCVDVDDLLATAAAGQAEVAVVALDAPGLDASAIEVLRRHGVRTVVVSSHADREEVRLRAAGLGVGAVVDAGDLESLVEAVCALDGADEAPAAEPGADAPPVSDGRVVAVWGPQGAPGRTTVAVTLAAEVARRGHRAVLVDADPYGGAVAQQLGVVDEMSGLLAAARLAAGGTLAERFPSVQRSLGPALRVVTGLPRPDRWAEVRPGALDAVLQTARAQAHVVVDTGFSLEQDAASDFSGRPARNTMTLAALDCADDVVVVGGPDPVSLARLARGLVDLRELRQGPVHVAVNRWRGSLGWSEREIAGMVEGFAPGCEVCFLPDDTATVDRAVMTGRSVTELGASPLAEAVAALADAVWPATAGPSRRRGLRRRTAGRDPRR